MSAEYAGMMFDLQVPLTVHNRTRDGSPNVGTLREETTMDTERCYGEERRGRYYSEEFGKWYDLYPCKVHGYHVEVDWDGEW